MICGRCGRSGDVYDVQVFALDDARSEAVCVGCFTPDERARQGKRLHRMRARLLDNLFAMTGGKLVVAVSRAVH